MYSEQDYQWARPYLEADETILWRGKPEKLHLLGRTDLYMIPFSILWCAFAVYWEWTAIRSGAGMLFYAFGGVFVLFGLFFVFGRFLYKYRFLKSCSYAVTNKKVLIRQKQDVRSLKKTSLPALSVKKYQDGTGTIELEHTSLFTRKQGYGMRYGMDMRSMCNIRDELHGISEPERVLRLLQEGNEE